MKRVILALSLLFMSDVAFCGLSRQTDPDYTTIGGQGFVQITSFTWTAIPSTTSIDKGRYGIILDVPSHHASGVVWRAEATDTAPTVAVSTGAIILPADAPQLYKFGGTIRIWARTLGTATTDFFFLEVK